MTCTCQTTRMPPCSYCENAVYEEESERREEEHRIDQIAHDYLFKAERENGREQISTEALLIELFNMANFRSASFGFPNDTVTVNAHFEKPITVHPDVFIRDKTKLYRDSWVNPLIQELARRFGSLAAADVTIKQARRAKEALEHVQEAHWRYSAETEALKKRSAELSVAIKDAEERLAFLREQLPVEISVPGRVISL